MNTEQIAEYHKRYESHLPAVASGLEGLIRDQLGGVRHIDRVAARAKDPERFSVKAQKITDQDLPKYPFPLAQIQDQIGARIVVFYQNDVKIISDEVEKYFTPIERQELVPESEWEFGYFGRHWIFALPDDVIPIEITRDQVPRFFELQVKTLFQHAWSEANHDLAYKPKAALTSLQQRQFAFTAAQAWGADDIFERLRRELEEGA